MSLPILGASKLKFFAIEAPISAKLPISGNLPVYLNNLEYMNIGTYSRVWSVPLNVGSFPWSADIINKSSSLNLFTISGMASSTATKALP